MDTKLETNRRVIAKHLHVVHNRQITFAFSGALYLHDKAQCSRTMPTEGQFSQLLSVCFRDRAIAIHPEEPLAASVPQRFIPRCGEVVTPLEVKQPSAQFFGNLSCPISRPGIDTTISSTQGRILSRQGRIVRSLSRQIKHSDSLIIGVHQGLQAKGKSQCRNFLGELQAADDVYYALVK
jgi:hypothetical protein